MLKHDGQLCHLYMTASDVSIIPDVISAKQLASWNRILEHLLSLSLQEFSVFLRNAEVLYPFHISPPLDAILSEINPFHILTLFLF